MKPFQAMYAFALLSLAISAGCSRQDEPATPSTMIIYKPSEFNFACIEGYKYFSGNVMTPYITTDPETGKGGFTKC
jgi:hypothetical protein